MIDFLIAQKDLLNSQIAAQRKEYYNYTSKIFKNPFKVQAMKKSIQASEGNRDVLVTYITQLQSSEGKVVDRNNFKEYSQQVIESYDMYTAQTDYGAEIYGAVMDARVACIGGEGINFKCSENKKKEEFVKKLFKFNKLNGSNLLSFILTGEHEGKILLRLSVNKVFDHMQLTKVKQFSAQKSYIKVSEFLWVDNQYRVTVENDEIKSITYKKDKKDIQEQNINLEQSVFIRFGGTKRDYNNTPHRMHRVITQAENLSRASYDLRKNSHLFGKIVPVWTEDYKNSNADNNIKALQKATQSNSFDIGQGYIGTGDFKFVGPPAEGVNVILKDVVENLRLLATNSGIPIHWLSYPELMSNRSTAENISRMMQYATCKERILWQEGFKELIDKAALMAVSSGLEDKDILNGEVDVILPLIDLDKVVEMIKELFVIVQAGKLPMSYILNRLPGIDPEQIQKELDAEKLKTEEENKKKIENESALRIKQLTENKENGNTENESDSEETV